MGVGFLMYVIVDNSVVDRLQHGDLVVQTRYFRSLEEASEVYRNMHHVGLFMLVPANDDEQYEPPPYVPPVVEEVVVTPPPPVEPTTPPVPIPTIPEAPATEGWSIERDTPETSDASDD